MSKILVLGSKERYALLIHQSLVLGLCDVDRFRCPPELNLAEAGQEYEKMDRDSQTAINRMVGVRIDLADVKHLPTAELEEEAAWRIAHVHCTRYEKLQECGGVDFWDYLIAGSARKLAEIRGGNERALHAEMAIVYKAFQLCRPETPAMRKLKGLMFGVDSVKAKSFFSSLRGEEANRLKQMSARLLKSLGGKKRKDYLTTGSIGIGSVRL
jgi:hypothetical protein